MDPGPKCPFASGASHGPGCFNFLYTEQGRRVPDTNNKLEACFRAVLETTSEKKIGRGTLVTGGKSVGGRIASQIGAAGADVEGLVSLVYPLHPPGKVDQLRAKHLSDIKVPMLIIQSSRDTFGTPDELRPIRLLPIYTLWKAATTPSRS